jgi:hypothetical protein
MDLLFVLNVITPVAYFVDFVAKKIKLVTIGMHNNGMAELTYVGNLRRI